MLLDHKKKPQIKTTPNFQQQQGKFHTEKSNLGQQLKLLLITSSLGLIMEARERKEESITIEGEAALKFDDTLPSFLPIYLPTVLFHSIPFCSLLFYCVSVPLLFSVCLECCWVRYYYPHKLDWSIQVNPLSTICSSILHLVFTCSLISWRGCW